MAQNSPSGSLARLPSLTSMRWIAALSVFGVHAVGYLFLKPDPTAHSVAFELSAVGVSYFFILSGFILTWVSRSDDSAPRFWRRRLFKIYPNHLVTFLAALVIVTFVSGQAGPGLSWLANLLLVQSYSPDLAVRSAFNGPAWTLSCELTFYLLFPLLLLLIKRIRGQYLWISAGVTVAAIFLMPTIASVTGPAQKILFGEGITDWDFYFVYQLPPVRLLEFVFGMIVARIVMNGQRRWLGLGWSSVLVVAAIALSFALPPVYGLAAVTVVPLGVLIASGAIADIGGTSRVLTNRRMVWFGEISYAFYVWHFPIILIGSWFVMGSNLSATASVAISIALLGVTIVVSWLQYSLIERPIMRRFANPRGARKPQQKVVVT